MTTLLVALALLVPSATAPAVEVAMPGKFYAPSTITVLTGTTVTWNNTDSATHTATADNDSFDSGDIHPGDSYERTFTRAGITKLHCRIHRFMRGEVRVYAVVLSGPDHPLGAHGRATLSGAAPEGASAVRLERRMGRAWREAAATTANEDGRFAFRVPASTPGTYRARAGNLVSPSVRVEVAPHVDVQLTRTRAMVATMPARPHARVALQRYDREKFTFVTVARTSLDAAGRAALRLRQHLGHLRVLVRGADGWADGKSRVFVRR